MTALTRVVASVLVASTVLVVSSQPAQGQSATTNDAVACTGKQRITLRWSMRWPLTAKVSLSATQCALPPACGTVPDGTPNLVSPITVEVTDSRGPGSHSLNATVTDPGVNGHGCPGHDRYQDSSKRLRFVYGSATTVIGKLQISPTVSGASDFDGPPVTFTIRDANGYAISGTANTCITKARWSIVSVKCF
jgi:hypothetical protein